ncbi:MAG: hypothetical protein BGO55_08340 [Sphingobacteriales bacterium 50-39]|nr:hypothetical protein [Sphingobacteriales bacterium]OJW59271.1 MAG: hypothetical protein BGO55_08340 [Sphingobacteriales bacterium 50-39]
MSLEQVISGGQTGIDRMALEVARECKITTGGTAAKGFMTENGPDYELVDFGLKEHQDEGYPPRTKQNVLDGDGTVMYGDINSGGTRLTKQYCIRFSRPYIENPTPGQLNAFIADNAVKVLNVAGNRASKLITQELERYRNIFRLSLEMNIRQSIYDKKGRGNRL